jgi:protein-S-isoprenylcysteine O-methyltransferase Ste14
MLIAGGIAGAAWATAAVGNVDLEHPDRVIAEGPYALSRHPMYVSWTSICLGVALAANGPWLLATLPPAVVRLHAESLAEERRLTREFGDTYRSYQAAVRRYA